MRREEMYVSIPSLFRCPISLDVMKSPVSLCTGVTYDRSSIQRWLESGHNTCPATMQVLPSKDFVPNLTLHRLINLWIHSSSVSSSPRPLVTADLVAALARKIETDCCIDSLSKVTELASSREENRRFLACSPGLVEAVAGVLSRNSVEIAAMEGAVRAMDSIMNENGVKERMNRLILRSNREQQCLSSIKRVLQEGKLNSKIESVRLLESIALDNDSKRTITEKHDLLPELLHLLQRNDNTPSLNDSVLSLLVSTTVTRSAKAQLAESGVVQLLTRSTITGKSLKLLATISSCSEGRQAISAAPSCVAGIVERLLKLSKTAAEDAVTVLWRMCCAYSDEGVKEAVVKGNGVTKLLVVLQREGEGRVRIMCGDLVKALRAKGACVGNYQTRTTHIMPC